MSSKTAKLKKNVEINAARSVRQWEKDNRTKAPEKVKRDFRKVFQKSAASDEKKLPGIWNKEKSNEVDTSNRPELGCYFGGVNFDKEGRIIR